MGKYTPARGETDLLTPPLATALEHVRTLHSDARTGTVSVCQLDGQQGRWRERRVGVRALPRYVTELPGGVDTYLSQARFSGRRKIVRLITVRSMWADLDTYKVDELAGLSDEVLLARVLAQCDEQGISLPSYVLSSGRGLCACWLHDTLPSSMLLRWQAAQAGLHERLAGLGPDPVTRDVTRVLRLVGSLHVRAQKRVRCLYPQVGEPRVYRFRDLARMLSPFPEPSAAHRARAELRQRRAPRPVTRLRLAASEGRRRPLGAWSLWGRRFEDFKVLRRIRWGDEPLPAGHRDIWLFLSAVALSWLIEDPAVLRDEVLELGRDALGGTWSDAQIEWDMGAALERAEMAARGDRIEWPPGSGEMVDPRYHYSDRRIGEVLAITDAERAQLPSTGQLGAGSLQARQSARGRRGAQRRAEAVRKGNADRDARFARLRAAGWSYQRIAAAHFADSGESITREGVRRAVLKAMARGPGNGNFDHV